MKVKLQKIKKRPCRICRKWFTPNNKLKERQKTCNSPKCKREWHKKICAKLNKKYRNDFSSNYMQKKIEEAIEPEKMGLSDSENYELPIKKMISVFSPQQVVIIINIINYHSFLSKR